VWCTQLCAGTAGGSAVLGPARSISPEDPETPGFGHVSKTPWCGCWEGPNQGPKPLPDKTLKQADTSLSKAAHSPRPWLNEA
jgi:hypothetical protein